MKLIDIYNTLLKQFGSQNWWPMRLAADTVKGQPDSKAVFSHC